MEAVLFCSGAPGCCQSHHRVAAATGAPQGCPRDTPTTFAGQGDFLTAEVPPCSDCWSHSKETTDHVLLECPTFVVHQANLASRYRDLGLPSDTANQAYSQEDCLMLEEQPVWTTVAKLCR
ncbi:uncharacterized protein LOC144103899 isoform X3 [Amblyomma americanum]